MKVSHVRASTPGVGTLMRISGVEENPLDKIDKPVKYGLIAGGVAALALRVSLLTAIAIGAGVWYVSK